MKHEKVFFELFSLLKEKVLIFFNDENGTVGWESFDVKKLPLRCRTGRSGGRLGAVGFRCGAHWESCWSWGCRSDYSSLRNSCLSSIICRVNKIVSGDCGLDLKLYLPLLFRDRLEPCLDPLRLSGRELGFEFPRDPPGVILFDVKIKVNLIILKLKG